jgi:hypothetical protein
MGGEKRREKTLKPICFEKTLKPRPKRDKGAEQNPNPTAVLPTLLDAAEEKLK